MDKILLYGFWGRGNCGDEAMLQCQYEFFSNKFDMGILVDLHGAYHKFWEWYPYNECSSIGHQGSINHLLDNKVKAIHFGGGGQSVGFGANQAFKAKRRGIIRLLTGIDIFQVHTETDKEVIIDYLSLFDYAAHRI